MKILYLVFEALLGGHVLSASTVAREMQSRGHAVVFAGKRGRMSAAIEESMPFFDVEIPVYHGERQTYFTWRSFAVVQRLRRLLREQQVELVHAFDARSYMHAYLAALLEGIPVVCTLCGGVDPYYNLPAAAKIIVFSEEQRRRMTETWRWPPERVEGIRTRLDVKRILDPASRLPQEELRRLGIDPDRPKLFMITSFGGLKIKGIHSLLAAVDLVRERFPVQMVFIGGSEAKDNAVVLQGSALNAKYGDKTVVMVDPVPDAFRFLQHADVVLGVGRSAFEGMAYGKPTIVVGNTGFAGVVAPEDIDAIAYYNFSGRNRPDTAPAEVLASEILSLLTDEARRQTVGEFGREYVMREFDVKRGAERIETVYAELRSNRFPPAAQGISFGACFFPVMRDNVLHRPKSIVRSMINRISPPSR